MRRVLTGFAGVIVLGLWACSSSDEPGPAQDSLTSQPESGSGADDGAVEPADGESAVGQDGDVGAGASGVEPSGGAASDSQEGAPEPTGLVGGEGDGNGGGEGNGNGGGSADPEAGGGDDASDEPEAPADPDPPVAAAICPLGPFADSPLGDASTPEVVCSGMGFTEGAVWFADRGTLFFSDIVFGANGNAGLIYSYVPGGQCEEFIQNAGTNGLAIAPDGNLFGCRHGDQTLTIFDLETKQPSVLVADDQGAAFNSPNDVAIRSDGNLYFTDPDYLRGNRPAELPTRAYWRALDGSLTVIDEGPNTNGITLSPDESLLYLSHLGGGRNDVVVFDVEESGALGAPSPFINVGSDGMGIDCAGNLYITQGGVQIFDPGGALIGRLNTPGAANVAFGGPERRTLYVTATDRLYAVELAIPGLPY